jgi:hypothetical protein
MIKKIKQLFCRHSYYNLPGENYLECYKCGKRIIFINQWLGGETDDIGR